MYKHKLPFTILFTACMFIIFFYCAAEYPIFVSQFETFNPDAPVAVADCYSSTNSTYYGPRQMEHWIRSGVGCCPVLCTNMHTVHIVCICGCMQYCRSHIAGMGLQSMGQMGCAVLCCAVLCCAVLCWWSLAGSSNSSMPLSTPHKHSNSYRNALRAVLTRPSGRHMSSECVSEGRNECMNA